MLRVDLVLYCFKFSQWNTNVPCMSERFFTEAGSQQSLECCRAWPHFPGPQSTMVTWEDAHGDHGCQMLFPWCRRMMGFVDPDSAVWQGRGRLCHTWEKKTLAGCEMLPNKVIPRVIARPVTRHRGIYSRSLCYWILSLNLPFVSRRESCLDLHLPLCEVVVNLETRMSWFEKEISTGTLHSVDISILVV